MSLNLRNYLQSIEGLDATISRVDPNRWAAQSPFADMTASGVVANVISVQNRVLGVLGQPATSLESPSGSQPATADLLAAWDDARLRVAEALDDRGALQVTGSTEFATMSVDELLGVYSVTPLISTWDVAVATGQTPVLDTHLISRAIERLELFEHKAQVPGILEQISQDTADRSLLDRFVVLSGRSVQGPVSLVEWGTDWVGADLHARSLGVSLVAISEFRVVLQFVVREEHCNSRGGLHGGVSFSAADIGLSTISNLGGPGAVAIDTHMLFSSGAEVGAEVVIDCSVLRRGRSLGFYRADVSVQGRLIGAFTGTAMTVG